MTIKQVQCLLAYLGYPVGAPDGIVGSQTRQAVKLFQAAEGLKSDGDPGQETQTALLAAVAAGRMYAPAKAENAETGTFWDDIQYFQRAEFRCQCGGKYCNGFPAEPEEALVRLAEQVRTSFDAPVVISSGVRCESHNAAVGGVKNSRHLLGKAMDFRVQNMSGEKVLALVRTLPIRYAYRIDDRYVHMDVA